MHLTVLERLDQAGKKKRPYWSADWCVCVCARVVVVQKELNLDVWGSREDHGLSQWWQGPVGLCKLIVVLEMALYQEVPNLVR